MSIAIWAGVAIAAGSLAYGIASSPGSPQTQAPPAPSSSVTYGDDGEVTSTQEYVQKDPNDPSKGGTWITRGRNSEPQKPDAPGDAPTKEKFTNQGAFGDEAGAFDEAGYNAAMAKYKESNTEYAKQSADYETKHAEWQKNKEQAAADKQKLADLRTKMLDNLNTTPEDRVKAYAEYQKTLSDSAHSEIDPRFAKIERTNDEQANATGMFGSRAYVDTKNELAKDKLKVDTDIETGAAMGKEQLASNDRAYWGNMLNQIDNGARADTLAESQVSKNAADVATQQYAGVLGQYGAQNSNILAKWQADQAKSASYVNAGTNLAGGLMYLYGNKTGTRAPTYNASKPTGEFT